MLELPKPQYIAWCCIMCVLLPLNYIYDRTIFNDSLNRTDLCSELTLIVYGRSQRGFHLFEPWLSQQVEFLHSHTCSKKTWWSSAPPCNWLCEYVDWYCSLYQDSKVLVTLQWVSSTHFGIPFCLPFQF